MKEQYYTYEGELNRSEGADFFNALFDQKMITYELKEEIKILLAKDERLEMTMEFPKMPPGMIGMLISKTNLYVNLKVTTIALLALILDAEITKGAANFILAATGFNVNSIVKLNEEIGEKCILLEIYMQQHHEAKLDIFDQICGKECINNHMNCRYRDQGVCTISKENVRDALERMVNKNVFSKNRELYKYNF